MKERPALTYKIGAKAQARPCGRARNIIDEILAFGRRAEPRHQPRRMQPIVEEAIGLLRVMLPATVTIRRRLEAADATVEGDASQWQQVVINLCTNAAHAIDAHGHIDVALDVVENVAERPLSHGTLAAGRFVRLTVTDNGRGMDGMTMERIFEPFFTDSLRPDIVR